MFKNYLTVAFRNLLSNRLYTAINIFGLAIGIASCILIVLYVRDELTFDRNLPDAARVYRLESRYDVPGRPPFISGTAPGPALPALLKDFSQIEAGVRMFRMRPIMKRGADVFREEMMMVDPAFFDVLALPLAAGDRATALADGTAVAISESMARKYFGTTNAVGRTIDITLSVGPAELSERSLHVTAVFKDLPDNSHLKIDFLGRINESDYDKFPWALKEWTSNNTWTYLKMRPGTDIGAIARALPEFEVRNVPNMSFNGQDLKVSDMMKLNFVPLTDIHLHSKGSAQMKPPGDVGTVTTFSIVAAMILLIACINFTNLATARASQRAREVALRKVLGAKRHQLIVQFLSESLLMAAIAMAIALGLVEAVLPAYNAVLLKHLALLSAGGMLAAIFVLICLVGVVAGLYPALVLSGFLPSRILKANKSAAAEGSGRLRATLVVIQFAISIGLLICTAVVYGQTVYAKTLDMGYDHHGLMVVRTSSQKQAGEILQTLKQEAARIPGVTADTIASTVPTDTDNSNNIVEIPGHPTPQPLLIEERQVDYDFFSTYKVPLIAGRFLDESHGGDDMPLDVDSQVARGANVVINQRALKLLGLPSAEAAIGLQVRIAAGSSTDKKTMMVTIVGVVGNFSYRSAREELEPTMFERRTEWFNTLTVRYEGVSGANVRNAMEKVWHQLASGSPYRAEFLDQLVEDQYRAEDTESKLFAAFAGLAIVIACLGLFGLAAFTAERRTREIGIRKVLGAKVRDVVRLLVWDFSKPVLVANLIAWPIAWILMRDWLNGFQFRIGLSPLPFALAGFSALAIAWVTVAGHAARAAGANPIHALRYE